MSEIFRHEKIDYADCYREARQLAKGGQFIYVDCDDHSFRLKGLRLETYNGTIFLGPRCGERTWGELNVMRACE